MMKYKRIILIEVTYLEKPKQKGCENASSAL